MASIIKSHPKDSFGTQFDLSGAGPNPFLGVHFTRMAKGGVEAGQQRSSCSRPRGYHHTDINLGDLWRPLLSRASGRWRGNIGKPDSASFIAPQQAGFCPRAAKACAGNSRKRSCSGRRRRARPGRVSQWRIGGRFCYQKPQRHSILNAIPRRNRLLGHRPSDYRHGGKEF